MLRWSSTLLPFISVSCSTGVPLVLLAHVKSSSSVRLRRRRRRRRWRSARLLTSVLCSVGPYNQRGICDGGAMMNLRSRETLNTVDYRRHWMTSRAGTLSSQTDHVGRGGGNWGLSFTLAGLSFLITATRPVHHLMDEECYVFVPPSMLSRR